MGGVLDIIETIFDYCWRIWNIKFTIGSFSFSLWNVAVVSVGIWVASMLITAIIDGD